MSYVSYHYFLKGGVTTQLLDYFPMTSRNKWNNRKPGGYLSPLSDPGPHKGQKSPGTGFIFIFISSFHLGMENPYRKTLPATYCHRNKRGEIKFLTHRPPTSFIKNSKRREPTAFTGSHLTLRSGSCRLIQNSNYHHGRLKNKTVKVSEGAGVFNEKPINS